MRGDGRVTVRTYDSCGGLRGQERRERGRGECEHLERMVERMVERVVERSKYEMLLITHDKRMIFGFALSVHHVGS